MAFCMCVWDKVGYTGGSVRERVGSIDGEERDESLWVRESVEEMMEEAPCPDAEGIKPCKWTNVTLDTLTMDCSVVTDGDQLSQVFSSSFPVTAFHQLVITLTTGSYEMES